jgi:hypothetical protein
MAAFTTIAAAAGLAATAAGTGMSFAQASKQRQAMNMAERDAQAAMEEARKKLEVNVYAGQAIMKEPYELEREALLSAGAQGIEAGVESERGAAATAGRVMMAQNEAQAGIRTAMGQDLMTLQNKELAEESRLINEGVKLDLAEVEGAQKAAADAQKLSAQATEGAMQGIQSMAQQGLDFIPLYSKSASASEFAKLQSDYATAAQSGNLKPEFLKEGKPLPFQQAVELMGGTAGGYGFNVSGIGGMNTNFFQDYMTQQKAENLKNMRGFGFTKK